MFTAFEDRGAIFYFTGDVIFFPYIHTNIGNHYDPSNGAFTCPYTGLYEFHVNVMSQVGYQCEASLVVANEVIVTAWAEESSYSEHLQASNHAYVNCTTGSQAWIEAITCYLYSTSNNHATFSGRLIQMY